MFVFHDRILQANVMTQPRILAGSTLCTKVYIILKEFLVFMRSWQDPHVHRQFLRSTKVHKDPNNTLKDPNKGSGSSQQNAYLDYQ